MEFGNNQISRPVAIAGFRGKQFVGYAVRAADGWISVVSIGMSWSKCACRTGEEARTYLRATAHANDLRWYLQVAELQQVLNALPEHAVPWIQPESLLDGVEHRPRIVPAAVYWRARG